MNTISKKLEINIKSMAPDGNEFAIPSGTEFQSQFERISREADLHRGRGKQIVAVQGLGFVGSAVAGAIAGTKDSSGESLFFVIGVDLPTPESYWKVAKLNEGLVPFDSPDPELASYIYDAVHKTRNLYATVLDRAYSLADVIIVDIPLDVKDRSVQRPSDLSLNLGGFEAAIRDIGRNMRPDALVLVETTVPAGICERIVQPVINDERDKRGIDAPLYLAHAYERVMPGPKYLDSIRQIWRTFAGINDDSAVRARSFLSSFIDTESYPLWELEDTNSSELSKLLENSYRAMNIAFIYEWTLLAEQIGVNLFEVVNSIRVRKGTHDNLRFPGFGVGGYCLPKDSLLAQWSSTTLFKTDVILNLTLEALKVNDQMPLHTLDLLTELVGGDLSGKKIAVCGVAYLPGVPDTRSSPSELFVNELLKKQAMVSVHDPYVITWPEMPDISVSQNMADCLADADGIVFAVPHPEYLQLTPQMLLEYAAGSTVIVDAQNILTDEKAANLHAAGCRLIGVGKGHWRKRGYQ
jgi:nucleotide sugar dehydrogenase